MMLMTIVLQEIDPALLEGGPWYLVLLMTIATGLLGLATIWMKASATAIAEKAKAEAQALVERSKAESRERTERVEAELQGLQIESKNNEALLAIIGDLVREMAEANKLSSEDRRYLSVAMERNNSAMAENTDKVDHLTDAVELLGRHVQALPEALQRQQDGLMKSMLGTSEVRELSAGTQIEKEEKQ